LPSREIAAVAVLRTVQAGDYVARGT